MRRDAQGEGLSAKPDWMPDAKPERIAVRIRGLVQGVGFRPFVYRLAQEERLSGWVSNDSDGVLAEMEGADDALHRCLERIRTEAPPLAQIEAVEWVATDVRGEEGFAIRASVESGTVRTGIPADAAMCDDCRRELLDPEDRRYRYPFLNCTNCGPRFTITRHIPYDRPQTSMAAFRMCARCQEEYETPTDRRFHAQPNACPECGPHLQFVDSDGRETDGDEAALQATIACLKAGGIVAIKGLGGFHLAVDAGNEAAVSRLRQRKHRAAKPLAILVADVETARTICAMDAAEEALLQAVERPIVLLRRQAECRLTVAASVAPSVPWLGVFLPYTPLHALLFAGSGLEALVMTSANLSEEPICIGNEEAGRRLRGIADAFLFHDREILQRCDDSVVAVVAGRAQFLRRARGYVPRAVRLPDGGSAGCVLAVGGQMKATLTLTKDGKAYASQHIGEMDSPQSLDFFLEALEHLQRTFAMEPEVVAHDLHPEYTSTLWAAAFARSHSLPRIGVQHHHAHLAGCLAEHGRSERALGLALDGTGYGSDGSVWGGELLEFDLQGFTRRGHLQPMPMPGSEMAIREPWRMALGGLATRAEADALRRCGLLKPQGERLLAQIAAGRSGPWTSSLGRLFDAVAAVAMGRHRVEYEAQAAVELEAVADVWGKDCYPTVLQRAKSDGTIVLDGGALLEAVLADRLAGVSAAVMATRFHRWVVEGFAEMVRDTKERSGLRLVCLSGGCLHNRLLTAWMVERLQAMGCEVLVPQQTSPGDGGLSYGQAVVASSVARREGMQPHRMG